MSGQSTMSGSSMVSGSDMGPGSSTVSGFSVVPADLAAVAGTFASQANALGEALQAFASHIESVGACWGNDTEGQKFGAAYLPGADQMLADLSDLQDGLDAVADALNASSNAYQDADVASTPVSSVAPASTPAAMPASAPI